MPVRAALLAVLVAGALAATPAAAQARFVLGIADQSTAMLADERFTALGVTDTRIVVPYDVALDPVQLARYAPFLDAADALDLRVLVAFNGPAGSKRLPSVRAYTKAMRAFRARFPAVRDLGTWNEANHASQPTARHPGRAAQYFNALRGLCRSCRIVAADVLDQADNPSASRPTFRKTASYIKRFRRALKTPRTICGIHNYSDVNRFRKSGTKALVKALGCKQIWLTEAGGIYSFPGYKPSVKRQLKATRYLFKVAKKIKRVKRVCVYNYFGGVTERFDAGLVAGGKPRPAFAEVLKHTR